MEIGHRFPTRQTTPTLSSARDYRTANPIYSNYSTTSLGCLWRENGERGKQGTLSNCRKTMLTWNVGRGRMEIGHRSPTGQTTPTPSSPKDYRTANPIYSNYSTTSPGCPMLLYLSAAGIYYFENPLQPEVFSSIFDGLWWAVATLTTVGYGDVYPVTAGGKIFTFIVLIIGLGVVAVPTGLLASALSEAIKSETTE